MNKGRKHLTVLRDGKEIYKETREGCDEDYVIALGRSHAPCKVCIHDLDTDIESNPLVFDEEKGGKA